MKKIFKRLCSNSVVKAVVIGILLAAVLGFVFAAIINFLLYYFV